MPKISRPNRPLADVNVMPLASGSSEIVACFMPDPDLVVGEGKSKAFVALDGSRSLKKMYGFGGLFGGEPNYVEMVARKLAQILGMVTTSGSVQALYWAVGPDGQKIESIGEFDRNEWGSTVVGGPKRETWGGGTKLLEVVKYAAETVSTDADWTMGVIVTDGILDDEQACIQYCLQIGREMESGQRKPIKLVLIGIGEEVDEGQLERFDDMFEGTGIDVDIWSHGMVSSMRDEDDILAVLYGELMTEDTIVAPTGYVETTSGSLVASFNDGVPGKFRFVLPKGEKEFVIHVGSNVIRQDVSEALA